MTQVHSTVEMRKNCCNLHYISSHECSYVSFSNLLNFHFKLLRQQSQQLSFGCNVVSFFIIKKIYFNWENNFVEMEEILGFSFLLQTSSLLKLVSFRVTWENVICKLHFCNFVMIVRIKMQCNLLKKQKKNCNFLVFFIFLLLRQQI